MKIMAIYLRNEIYVFQTHFDNYTTILFRTYLAIPELFGHALTIQERA